MNRDNIDWEKTDIPALFRKMFIPTLLGMLLGATINIADGCFVGHGAGSDALAAVNIVAPFFLLATGMGLMFGCGASIAASVHLSQSNVKAARINVTQAYIVAMLFMVSVAVLVMTHTTQAAVIMGSSERLMPLVKDYMRWVIPAMPFGMLMSIGLFVIRLDGSPKFAMWCNIIPAVINIVFDYLLVMPFGMGIEGAAIATAFAEFVGAMMIVYYMACKTKVLTLYKLKASWKSVRLTARNIYQQAKLGAPSMIGELAIACMMFTGNYAFLKYLGEDGVAAFSVACYCFPLVFMVGNAIAQSVQPIISYNHGAGLTERVRKTFHLSLKVAVTFGIIATIIGLFFSNILVTVFVSDTTEANHLASYGMRYFSVAFLLFSVNLVCIGYYQSLERYAGATILMLLRGAIFVIPAFLFLPKIIGVPGLWLAVPVSEILTFLIMMAVRKRF